MRHVQNAHKSKVNIYVFIIADEFSHTQCPKIFRKTVLHLFEYRFGYASVCFEKHLGTERVETKVFKLRRKTTPMLITVCSKTMLACTLRQDCREGRTNRPWNRRETGRRGSGILVVIDLPPRPISDIVSINLSLSMRRETRRIWPRSTRFWVPDQILCTRFFVPDSD